MIGADKMEGCDQLLLEQATLHGKLEDHGKALDILVHQLRDYGSAEAYCLWASSSSSSSSSRQHLLHLLLDLYLDGGAGERSGDLEMAAVDLLNRHGDQFDAVRVLSVLPEGWSLQLLKPFLGRAVRASVHAGRTSRLALGLSRAENLQLLHDRVSTAPTHHLISHHLLSLHTTTVISVVLKLFLLMYPL